MMVIKVPVEGTVQNAEQRVLSLLESEIILLILIQSLVYKGVMVIKVPVEGTDQNATQRSSEIILGWC